MSTTSAGTTRARNPKGQGTRLKEDLIAAAMTLMEDGTPGQVPSARAVTRAVGVAPQSFYLHFDDMDDLLWEVYDREYARLAAQQQDAVAAVSDPLERLKTIGLAYLEFARENPAAYRLMLSARGELTRPAGGGRAGQATWNLLRDCVAACLPDDPEMTAPQVSALLWASLHGIAQLRDDRPFLRWVDDRTVVEHLVQGFVLDPRHGGG